MDVVSVVRQTHDPESGPPDAVRRLRLLEFPGKSGPAVNAHLWESICLHRPQLMFVTRQRQIGHIHRVKVNRAATGE